MNKTFEEYKETLKTIKGLEERVKESIQNRIKECEPLEGVSPLSSGCYSVRSSTIFKTQGLILSPDYYSPEVQVREVMTYLFKEDYDLMTVIKRLEDLIDKKYVVNRGNKTLLNDNMVQVLKGVIIDLS